MTAPSHPVQSRARAARRALVPAIGLALAFALTGCSGDAAPAAESAATTPAAAQADALTITDPWVKAADSGMTAAFGTLVNDSGADVRIVSASTSVSSSMELHEMATNDAGEMIMRPKEGGIVVPADGTHELAPGGDHLMFVNITTPVQPGDEVTVTLTAEDGSTFDFVAPARSFAGGDETYEGDGAMEGMESSDATPMSAAS